MGIIGNTQGVASEIAPIVIASQRKGQKPLERACCTSAAAPDGEWTAGTCAEGAVAWTGGCWGAGSAGTGFTFGVEAGMEA